MEPLRRAGRSRNELDEIVPENWREGAAYREFVQYYDFYNTKGRFAAWHTLRTDIEQGFQRINICIYRHNWVIRYWHVTRDGGCRRQLAEIHLILDELDNFCKQQTITLAQLDLLLQEEWAHEDYNRRKMGGPESAAAA